MVKYEAITGLTMKTSQAGHTVGVFLALLDDETKVHRETLIRLRGMASSVLGVPRGLVKLISGTNRAVIKFVTVGQSRNTMNVTMKVRGTLEADVPKSLVHNILRWSHKSASR